MGKRWVEEEIDILKENYPNKGAKETQKILLSKGFDRTIYTIHTRTTLLKIPCNVITMPSKDLTGNKFNSLTVIEKAKSRRLPCGKLVIYWLCECDCGGFVVVSGGSLISGHTKTCGDCCPIEIGNLYGDLEVLCQTKPYSNPNTGHETAKYICLCKCEKYSSVVGVSLKNGHTKSCNHCTDIVLGKMYYFLKPIKRIEDHIDRKTGWHYSQYLCECLYNGPKCKKFKVVRAVELNRGGIKSCGCLRLDKITGPNNSNYKCPEDRVSPFVEEVRKCSRGKKWTQNVLKRDNYICQKCGQISGRINAHHIKFFIEMFEELIVLGITCVEDIPDDSEFWDTDNGVTLCVDCHKEVHKLFTKESTKEEFFAWLEIEKES